MDVVFENFMGKPLPPIIVIPPDHNLGPTGCPRGLTLCDPHYRNLSVEKLTIGVGHHRDQTVIVRNRIHHDLGAVEVYLRSMALLPYSIDLAPSCRVAEVKESSDRVPIHPLSIIL